MNVQLMPGVYWVGAVDWAVRRFHGFELSTHHGTTYNAYLIRDRLNVLVDTVWTPFQEVLLGHIREIMDPADLDLIVLNHAEVDHSGAIARLVELCPKARIVVSRRGAESIPHHYHRKWSLEAVETGQRISIGNDELLFIEAPMLHWPDSMFTYVTGHGLLLSNDAFGQHYATAFRFNDQVDEVTLIEEALKYYVNILTPFSERVMRKIEELRGLNLPLRMIAPSHGVIWRTNPLQIVERYLEWAAQKPCRQAVIIYDTMWNATARMADAVAEGLGEAGVPHKVFHAALNDRNDLLVEIFKSGLVIFGSCTFNGGILPSLAPVVEELHGLRMKNKLGAAFGSYGWSGESVKLLEGRLQEAGITIAQAGLRVKWQPSDDDLRACRQFGRALAQKLIECTSS